MNAYTLPALLALCLISTSAAASTATWVEVSKVEPITETRHLPSSDPACRVAKPSRSAGLSALLSWDLTPDCSPRARTLTTHYRVFYEWAGREYHYLSRTLPGHKIRLNLQVDPI